MYTYIFILAVSHGHGTQKKYKLLKYDVIRGILLAN